MIDIFLLENNQIKFNRKKSNQQQKTYQKIFYYLNRIMSKENFARFLRRPIKNSLHYKNPPERRTTMTELMVRLDAEYACGHGGTWCKLFWRRIKIIVTIHSYTSHDRHQHYCQKLSFLTTSLSVLVSSVCSLATLLDGHASQVQRQGDPMQLLVILNQRQHHRDHHVVILQVTETLILPSPKYHDIAKENDTSF